MSRNQQWGAAGLGIFAAIFLGGCSSSQIGRIDSNRDIYESWPIETRQAVLDGKVEQGMTPDMVQMAIGKPTEKVASPGATGEEIWIYRKGGVDDSMMGYPGSYPSASYPGGGYPGSGYPSSSGNTIGITTGRGGTGIITGGGLGIGGGMGGLGGMGGSGPMVMGPPMRRTPAEEREVVFRDGVVFRADQPVK
ncbi:MAG: hypothetical protein EXS32_14485 [Opitutus sp.]|nr:hypothetical protein [Opitutus sp.]